MANTDKDGTPVTKCIVAPKGIYKTPHGYRVQLNIEHTSRNKQKPKNQGFASVSSTTQVNGLSPSNRGKFSRNAKNFADVSVS